MGKLDESLPSRSAKRHDSKGVWSLPNSIPGLFVLQDYRAETHTWHDVLIMGEDGSTSKLIRMEFCKTRGEKLHEFLVLYFAHPTRLGSPAVAVVDRAVKDRSQFSSIVSPSVASQNPTEATDRVHVLGQGHSLETHLSKAYGQYDTLCTLKFARGPDSASPSAIQLSTLLFVTS